MNNSKNKTQFTVQDVRHIFGIV